MDINKKYDAAVKREKLIRQLLQEGRTDLEIAEILSLHISKVSLLLNKN